MTLLDDVVAAADPALHRHAAADPGPGRFDPEVCGRERAFVLEAVYEGYLLHYGDPRLFGRMDSDLRLLAGDALYALGLASLAEAGDLEAVSELSDLISLSARAHAEGKAALAGELWEASACALSHKGGAGARAAAQRLEVFSDGR